VRIGVFLVVSAAFGDDGFDFGNAVLDCLFIGDGDALAFDLALRHTLPNELCEDIAGEDSWSFASVRERLQLGELRLRGAYAWWWALLELDWSARSH